MNTILTLCHTHRYKTFFLVLFIFWFLNGFFAVISNINNYAEFSEYKNNFTLSIPTIVIIHDLVVETLSPNASKYLDTPSFPVSAEQPLVWLKCADTLEKIKNNTSANSIYKSQVGWHKYILAPFWHLGLKLFQDSKDDIKYWKAYRITELGVALLGAAAFALLATFLAVEFGIIPVALSNVLIMFFNQILTLFMRNIYWNVWSWLAPALFACYILNKEHIHHAVLFLGVAFFIALKNSMIFEFNTTIFIAATIPSFYFAISRSWTWKKFLTAFFVISGACITGFLIVYLYYIIDFVGLEFAETIFLERIGLLTAQNTAISAHQNAYGMRGMLSQNIQALIFTYSINFIWVPAFIFLRKNKLGKDSLGAGAAISPNKYIALCVCCIVAFLGTISWYILFIPHTAHIRKDMGILYYFPFWFLFLPLAFFKPLTREEFINTCRSIPILNFFRKTPVVNKTVGKNHD